MHRVAHEIGHITREIRGLLRQNPNNTPTFHVLVYANAAHVRPMGLLGKRAERVITDHGFWTGHGWHFAFFKVIDNLAADGMQATLSWLNKYGKRVQAPYSRDQLASLDGKPVRHITLKVGWPKVAAQR